MRTASTPRRPRTAGLSSREAQIMTLIAREPLTAHELVEEMWKRKLSPFHHHFAVFEILAHLEYLARRGRVLGQVQTGGALHWEPAKLAELPGEPLRIGG